MLTFDVNWLAIIVAAIANMIVGSLWYGPLFGKPWMEELGLTTEDIQGGDMVRPFAVAIFNSLMMAFMLANVMSWTGGMGAASGLMLAFFMWLGFNGFSFGANHAFEGRSLKLWAINTGTYLAGLLVQGLILGLWQ